MNRVLCIAVVFVCSFAFSQDPCTVSVAADGKVTSPTACDLAGIQPNQTPPTPSAATTDGPAELPRIYIKSSLADTPSPGAQINVKAGSDLNAAYLAAKCGDILLVAPGASWNSPNFPTKGCDDAHWVRVRADIADSSLPPEGTRITPQYAPVMAQFTLVGNQTIKVADRVRLGPGINIIQVPGHGITYNFMTVVNKVVLDRVWFQGSPTDEANHGLSLNGANYIAVVDSYFTNFHCNAPGSCSDAQAIHGGGGNHQDGPFKISNNFIEASGEGILFGGGPATTTPADIEVTRNHFFKPKTWNPSDPTFDGLMRTTKNHFELKNAQRVLFEGNVLENNWGGFSQAGFAILLTPKNQVSGTTNQCPSCVVRDVTIRYSRVMNTGGLFQIANATGSGGLPATEGSHYSIHDVLAEDVPGANCYKCGNYPIQITSMLNAPNFILHDVAINHITLSTSNMAWGGGMMTLGGTPMPNISITNSIIDAGAYGPWDAGLGTSGCAYGQASPKAKFDKCFIPYSFAGNVIARGMTIQQGKVWPSGNLFPTNISAVGFVSAIDFHLSSTSLYKGKATDGKDPGADVDAVMKAIAGVQ
jgi:hypothetical protein